MFDPMNPQVDVPPPPDVGGGPNTTGPQAPPPNPQAGYADSIQAWYRQYLGRDGSANEIQSWLNGGTPIQAIEQAIANSAEAKAYAAKNAPAANQNPPPPVGQGGAPPPNVGGGLTAPFGQTFTPPSAKPYPNAPSFTPPSMGDAANDPGYQFALQQGKRDLDSWLSAHGTFNDSSAAEALQNYGQGAAATQYGNVWNRAYQSYQGALQPWQTEVSTTQHDNDMAWQNAFNSWLQNWNIFRDQRDSTWNKGFQWATA